MKKVLLIALFSVLTCGVHAQTGIPQSLTCTEKAFNFSFSVGSKWKFSAPKMGPLDASSYQTAYPKIMFVAPRIKTPDSTAIPKFR